MLELNNKLHFPVLQKRFSCGDFAVYVLDWSRQEQITSQNIDKSLPDLPPEYRDKIRLHFGLKKEYLEEIRRCTKAAINEISIERKINGSMETLCLRPCVAYVETAFRLLADSILDKDNSYTRDYSLKTIAFHSLLYKFWHNQTNKINVYEYSRLYELAQVNRIAQKIEDPSNEITMFLNSIKANETH